jgi:hypothetical protein
MPALGELTMKTNSIEKIAVGTLVNHPILGLCRIELGEDGQKGLEPLWQKGDILVDAEGQLLGTVVADATDGMEGESASIRPVHGKELAVGIEMRNLTVELRAGQHDEKHVQSALAALGL